MKTRLLLFFATSLVLTLSAQDPLLYRTIDGSQNNLNNPDWGAAHTHLLNFAGVGFADGFAAPAGPNRPNPRRVSNIIFDQPEIIPEPMNLSDYVWVFGQFIDHDLGLTEGFGEAMNILVPQGDPEFDPLGFGNVVIPVNRTIPVDGTGTGIDNPSLFDNEITAFIDGSAVYGSETAHANWLRTFVDGKMKVSAGNFLPYNTIDGEYDSDIDPTAPHMADAVGFSPKLFVAGDVRANENPVLAGLHTLFVREHNRRADIIKSEHPDWDDEQIYQHARKYVGGIIQAITYNEWLPAMGIDVPAYTGYNDTIHPQLTNTFTAAAFRVGHTLLNSVIRRVDDQGNEIPEGHLPLRFAFFNISAVTDVGGLDPYFAGMAQQVQQTFDARVVSDIRSFLFGPPGAGGLDLAAINIQRGRDRGLPTFNQIRQAYGLEPYIFLEQINSDLYVYGRLFQAYFGDVNALDPWVGMLAENRMGDALFGETLLTILRKQFQDLRDGDRFYYLNDPVLTDAEKTEIHNTTFRDVIMHNSGITLMQDNVFLAMDYSDICANSTSTVGGSVTVHTTNQALPDVEISYLVEDTLQDLLLTEANGQFIFTDAPACQGGMLSALRDNDQWINGVTVQDIIFVSRHILGIAPLTDPYQLLAADANNDGNINVTDIIAQRRLILDLDQSLPGDLPMWVFIPGDFEFTDPTNPWADNIPSTIDLPQLVSMMDDQSFIAYKRGDVNASADLGSSSYQSDPALLARTMDRLVELSIKDIYVENGQTVNIPIRMKGVDADFQFALSSTRAEFNDIRSMNDELEGFVNLTSRGEARFCGEHFSDIEPIFVLNMTAQYSGFLCEILKFNQEEIMNIAVDKSDNEHLGIASFDWRSSSVIINQNISEDEEAVADIITFPNPFVSQLTFDVPAQQNAGVASLEIFDMNGRMVMRETRDIPVGVQDRWTVQTGNLPAGKYSYMLVTTDRRYHGHLMSAAR